MQVTHPEPRENPALVGQDAAQAVFLSAWRARRMPHAWLIAGPEGVGKATLAYRIARFVLAGGNGDSLSLAQDHPVYRRVASGGHSDLLTLSRDFRGTATGTAIGVDAARAAGDFVHLTAGRGRGEFSSSTAPTISTPTPPTRFSRYSKNRPTKH